MEVENQEEATPASTEEMETEEATSQKESIDKDNAEKEIEDKGGEEKANDEKSDQEKITSSNENMEDQNTETEEQKDPEEKMDDQNLKEKNEDENVKPIFEKQIPLENLDLPEDIVIPPMPPTIGVGAPGEPRLIITHIVNYNFKSYAGRQVLGPFHKSFSSIVGPNGSGKSNVIDSMLFVFGYRANKIRSKKLSVLIHNSENHKGCTSCTVEVFFQKIIDKEGDDFEVVPNSKFTVSRSAFKDNSSTYKIDNKKVTFKQVTQFLRNSGIDLDHNRFLILQGEVEQIALMKPRGLTEHDEGMLEFLEDIIGSSRYKAAIEKLAEMVEELNDKRSEKLARVKGVEKDKDELAPRRNEALAYLREQNEVVELQNSLIQLYLRNLAKEETVHLNKKEEIIQSMSGYQENLNAVLEEKKVKVKEFKKISKAFEKKEALFQEKQDKMGELEKLNVKIFEDRKHARNKAKELKTKLEKEIKKLAETEKIPEKNKQQAEELSAKLETLAEHKESAEQTLNEAMQSLNEETAELQSQKDEKEGVLMHLMKDVNESKQRLDVAKAELDIYMSTHDKAVATLNEISEKIDTGKQKLEALTAEKKELDGSLPKIKSHQQKISRELEELRRTESQIEIELKKNKGLLADAEHSARSAKSQGKVLDFLLELKNSGKLKGIYGRLGDLGAIDVKYDVAISSCCPSLENILVDNIETAQQCVQYLKKNNVGKATFIALDKMMKNKDRLGRKPNVSLPRIVDLIKVENEEFRLAFYHALRDTLVAPDLPQASKVAYGKDRRWRVVTLKGELIDTSGTMTGGGNRVIKGRMGSKCVSQETVPVETINKLRKTTENMEIKFRDIRGKIAVHDEECEKMQRQIHNATCKISQLDMEENGLKAQLKQFLSQKPECVNAVKNSKPDPKKENKMRDEITAIEKTFYSANKKASKIETEKDKIHAAIMDISSNKLKPAKDALKKASSELEDAKKKITKLKVGIKTAERNVEKGKNTIEAIKRDGEENATKLEELENQWTQLETDGQTLLEELEVVTKEKQEISDALQECQTFLQECDKKEKEAKVSMREFQHSLEATEAAIAEHKEKVAKWKERLRKLKLSKVDKDEVPVLPTLTEEQLEELDEEAIKTQISVKEHKLSTKEVNMAAIDEYNAKEEIYLKRVAELDEATKLRNKHRMQHDELRKRRLLEFTSGFMVITNKLKEMYQMITQGGDAELEFVDSLDPFSEGIVFTVRPPKKSWKNISNLSGGEKTLSSLALVFALHHYRPTPLYVMDEIDAALDFKNVSIIAIYIKERTRNAQFIIISLRNNMFELADRLVGIYKTDNCTKSVNIEPKLMTKKIITAAN